MHHNAMIKGLCRSGMLNEALMCMNRMAGENLVPDEFTYSTIMDGVCKAKGYDYCLEDFSRNG